MKLTKDEFEAWRGNPMTELILDRYLEAEKQLTRNEHDDEAWGGPLSEARHAVYRERFETLEFVQTLDFEELQEWLSKQTQ